MVPVVCHVPKGRYRGMQLSAELFRGVVRSRSLSTHLLHLLAGIAQGMGIPTALCATPARRRKAFTTSVAFSSPVASLGTSSSTVVSVILTSAAVRICFARGMALRGMDGISGRAGVSLAMLASR